MAVTGGVGVDVSALSTPNATVQRRKQGTLCARPHFQSLPASHPHPRPQPVPELIPSTKQGAAAAGVLLLPFPAAPSLAGTSTRFLPLSLPFPSSTSLRKKKARNRRKKKKR